MKLLVVARMFSAVRDALKTDGDQAKGMPGFLKAMAYFTKQGVDIDYVFITPVKQDVEILQKTSRLSFLPTEKIKGILYRDERLNRYTRNAVQAWQLKKLVAGLCKETKYDFIYAMTPETVCVNELANELGIPCGMRLFGTFLWSFLKKNGLAKAKFFFKSEIKAYNTPKAFLLTTNDGSNGNDSYQMFCKDKTLYDFHYWVNGLDRSDVNEARKAEVQATVSENDIVYVATVTGWKRHDRAIEMVKIMRDRGYTGKLLLVGNIPPDCAAYKQRLDDLIAAYGLQDQVVFKGSMAREDFLYLAMKAKVCPLFQDTTNMGNVFHELFGVGAVIISLNDGSLDGFLEDGKNGFLVENMEQAADIAEKLISGEIDVEAIRQAAMETSRKLLCSWDERFEKELELIRNAIK